MLDVFKGDKYIGQLNPELRSYKPSMQPDHIVANRSTLREDLYVVYEGRNPDTQRPIIKAMVKPLVVWVWLGVIVLILGTGLALVPNAAPMKSPVQVSAGALAKQLQPAGAGK